MYSKLTKSTIEDNKSTFIKSLCLPGPHQMALDVLMIERSIARGNDDPILRFYSWDGPWLSIGKNQKVLPNSWKLLAKEGKIKATRRPSGGGTVLHSGGLTYAFVWPHAPRKRHEAYKTTCEWIIDAFRKSGIALKFGTEISKSIENNCFMKSTPADLVDKQGFKRVGSAQFWKKGQLLQHGEILLNPPQKLWMDIFNSPPPESFANMLSREILEKELKKTWLSNLGKSTFEVKQFSKDDLVHINEEAKKYII